MIEYQFAAQRPGPTKLTERDVRAIHVYLKHRTSRAHIADLFDVGVDTINEIARGRRWGHVKETDEND